MFTRLPTFFILLLLLILCRFNTAIANDSANACSSSLSSQLFLHVPVIEIDNQYYWADFIYSGESSLLSLQDYGKVSDLAPFLNCYPSSLKAYGNFETAIHIPSLIYGGISYWVNLLITQDLKFKPWQAAENFPLDFNFLPQCKGYLPAPPFSFPICSCLRERWTMGKPVHTEVRPGYDYENFVIIKFIEGSDIRLRYGELVSLNGASLSSFNQVMSKYDIIGIQRIFTRPEDELDRERFAGERNSCEQLADLNLYYRLVIDPKITVPGILIDDLNSLEIIEIAYPQPIPSLATLP